jgi:predicted outer membrane repeat protein
MTRSATITDNTADQGGGIHAGSGSILVGVTCGPGGNVYGNTPDDCYFESQ